MWAIWPAPSAEYRLSNIAAGTAGYGLAFNHVPENEPMPHTHILSQNIYTTYRCTHASCWPLFIFTPFEETSAFYPLFPRSTRHVAFVLFFFCIIFSSSPQLLCIFLAQISFPLPMASFYDSYAKNSWAPQHKKKIWKKLLKKSRQKNEKIPFESARVHSLKQHFPSLPLVWVLCGLSVLVLEHFPGDNALPASKRLQGSWT